MAEGLYSSTRGESAEYSSLAVDQLQCIIAAIYYLFRLGGVVADWQAQAVHCDHTRWSVVLLLYRYHIALHLRRRFAREAGLGICSRIKSCASLLNVCLRHRRDQQRTQRSSERWKNRLDLYLSRHHGGFARGLGEGRTWDALTMPGNLRLARRLPKSGPDEEITSWESDRHKGDTRKTDATVNVSFVASAILAITSLVAAVYSLSH